MPRRVKYSKVLVSLGDGGKDLHESSPQSRAMSSHVIFRPKLREFLKTSIPHVVLVVIVLLYTYIGAALFLFIEKGGQASPQNTTAGRTQQMWTFEKSTLLAFTILTTCGYDGLYMETDAAKICAFWYGMLGIPFMFLTGADLGKFLAGVVTDTSAKYERFIKKVQTWLEKRRQHAIDMTNSKDEAEVPRSRKMSHRLLIGVFGDIRASQKQSLFFPVMVYFSVLVVYCSLGSVLFMFWENDWRFLYYFHFAFNCITTIALGNVEPTSSLYVLCIIIYLTIGLAVISMCFDLAASHVKIYFQKLHYFGRQNVRLVDFKRKFWNLIQSVGEPTEDHIGLELQSTIDCLKLCKAGLMDLDDLRRLVDRSSWRPYVPKSVTQIGFIDECASISSWTVMRRHSITSDLVISNSMSFATSPHDVNEKKINEVSNHKDVVPFLDA